MYSKISIIAAAFLIAEEEAKKEDKYQVVYAVPAGHVGYGAPAYGHAPYAAPYAAPVANYGGHYGGAYQHQAPTHYGGHYPQQHGWNQHQYNPYGHGHNPFQPVAPAKPEGWYTAHVQFKPAAITYMAAPSYKTNWAICEMPNVTIQFNQRPGKAIAVLGEAVDCPAVTSYDLAVATYGKCDDDASDDMFTEFNPLEEKDHMGNVVMYQDPSRGRIDGFTTDAAGTANSANGQWPIQFDFLQNLSGDDSILGRSIYLIKNTTEEDGSVTKSQSDCCIVGRDAAPAGTQQPQPQHHHWNYQPAHQPTYYSGW